MLLTRPRLRWISSYSSNSLPSASSSWMVRMYATRAPSRVFYKVRGRRAGPRARPANGGGKPAALGVPAAGHEGHDAGEDQEQGGGDGPGELEPALPGGQPTDAQ